MSFIRILKKPAGLESQPFSSLWKFSGTENEKRIVACQYKSCALQVVGTRARSLKPFPLARDAFNNES